MRTDVARDLSKSREAFLGVVWPVIQSWFGGGEVVPVESVTQLDFSKKCLDMMAGIDAWHICKTRGQMRGVASRVQFGPKNWDTFTVRFSRHIGTRTEFQKRLEAICSDERWLYPAITVQAYVNESSDFLLSAAAVSTADLIWTIHRGKQGKGYRDDECDWYMQENSQDGNQFAVVKWEWLKRKGKLIGAT